MHYLEFGKSKEQTVFWFVMELLNGEPLDTILRNEGPWQEIDAIKVCAGANEFMLRTQGLCDT